MKTNLKLFLRLFIFWVLVFLFFRILFLISQLPITNGESTLHTINSLFAGYRLDLSTAAYLIIFPFIFLLIRNLIRGNLFRQLMNGYHYILIFVVVVLSLSNIIIYKYWGTLLNNRALSFAFQPSEMLASVTATQLLLIIVALVLFTWTVLFFYKKFIGQNLTDEPAAISHNILSAVIILPVLVIAIRGGMQLIPINESAACYSTNQKLNQIATNNLWYLGHNLKESGINEQNPYNWFNPGVADSLTNSLFIATNKDSVVSIFTESKQPNIVILLLESYTADVIEPLGGDKGVAKNFTGLCKDGLLFNSVYSSGFRTDQALVSVLSGFPAQPNKSIIRFPDKTIKLPSLPESLKNTGYNTSFYYGGELGFANMNTYLTACGISKIVGKEAFNDENMNSKWGAHDGFVLTKQLNDLENQPQPFFSTLLTLSTHEPFEVPITTPFDNDKSEPGLFRKAAYYTDESLGEYFNAAKTKNWFANTIFILVADHGHRLPRNRDYYDPEIRHIPLLIYSPLLKTEFKGKQYQAVSNQNDLAATILNQLHISSTGFEWSNDMLNVSRKNFAFQSLDNAFTWVTDSGYYVYSLDQQKVIDSSGKFQKKASDSTIQSGKAYLQKLYSRFLSY